MGEAPPGMSSKYLRHLYPTELLELGNANRTPNYLTTVWPEVLGVFFGLSTGAIINFATRRPTFSGLHKYAISTAVWIGTLKYVQKYRDDYYRDKDAVLRHYVQLHPEYWPPLTKKTLEELPKKKYISEVIEPWTPIR